MNRKAFADKIRRKELIVAPGIYDMISAHLADQMGLMRFMSQVTGLVPHIWVYPMPVLPPIRT